MLFFARHRRTTEEEIIIKIMAKSKEEAEKLNENWQIGMRNDPDRVEVVNRERVERDYSASNIREKNDFYGKYKGA
jgi:hypothetical protein